MKEIERRAVMVEEFEVRQASEGEPEKIIGYAARFNKLSEDLGFFREKISPGAFKESIKNDDVRALWNHDSNYVLGRNKAGTLAMEEDEKGLRIEITPPNTTWANDLKESIRRKDVDQMSFGFTVEVEEWDESDKDNIIRTLKQVRLFDVSPVTFPAYPQTKVGVRSVEDVYKSHVGELQRDKPTEEETPSFDLQKLELIEKEMC